jgi:hypothetical protein
VYWRETSELIPAGAVHYGVVASCDDGDFATGAGWIIEGNEDDLDKIRVASSVPEGVYTMTDRGSAWQVGFARVEPGPSVMVTVFVHCLSM